MIETCINDDTKIKVASIISKPFIRRLFVTQRLIGIDTAVQIAGANDASSQHLWR